MLALLIFLITFGVLRLPIEGKTSLKNVRSSFINGDVTFTWNVSTNETSPVHPILYNNSWINLNDTRHIVKDVFLYKFITIDVIGHSDFDRWTYKVCKYERQNGNSVQMEWPNLIQAQGYNVHHTSNETRVIIQIESSGDRYEGKNHSSKYVLINRPDPSTSIAFDILNVTLDDAGFYSIGTKDDDLSLDRGYFLTVTEKPVKPKIKGNLRGHVTKYIELICSSKSTSVPDYYFKRKPLAYTWFVNETKGEIKKTLRFKVEEHHKYNRYSCTATEEDLESERSDPVQINPLSVPQTPLNLTVNSDENDTEKMAWVSGFKEGSTPESVFVIDKVLYLAVGVAVSVFIVTVILVAVSVTHFKRKHRTERKSESFQNKQRQFEKWNTYDTDETDGFCQNRKNILRLKRKENQKSAGEVYTFVEKSFLKETDKLKNDVAKNEDDNPEQTSTSECVSNTAIQGTAENLDKEICLESEENGRSNKADVFKNNEGLVYIDVEFTNKSQKLDTDEKPLIRGADERTEYIFVDFTKKAPPTQEMNDNVENQDEG